MRLDLIQPVGLPLAVDQISAKEVPTMIFREFLAPKTGCASYLFG
jgi:hypothetical protein